MRTRRELRAVRPELSSVRPQLRNLEVLERVFLPKDHDLYQAHVLDPTGDRLLLLEWSGDHDLPTSGLQVWRATSVRDPRSTVGWELIFSIEPQRKAGYVLIGAPGSMSREPSDASSAFFTGFGDVTGDARSDLAIQQWNFGSGGCGMVRVMENTTNGLEEIFRREDCDHRAQIRNGRLAYISALWPKGCRSAHGCGRRTTIMEWAGSTWDVVKVKRTFF
jgi:hypothetical protein